MIHFILKVLHKIDANWPHSVYGIDTALKAAVLIILYKKIKWVDYISMAFEKILWVFENTDVNITKQSPWISCSRSHTCASQNVYAILRYV